MSNQNDSQNSLPQYDAHIIPSESVPRHYSYQEADRTSSQATDGYMVDKEGLLIEDSPTMAEYALQLQDLSDCSKSIIAKLNNHRMIK